MQPDCYFIGIYDHPHLRQPQVFQPTPPETPGVKYEKSGLRETEAGVLLSKLKAFMETARPSLNVLGVTPSAQDVQTSHTVGAQFDSMSGFIPFYRFALMGTLMRSETLMLEGNLSNAFAVLGDKLNTSLTVRFPSITTPQPQALRNSRSAIGLTKGPVSRLDTHG